MSAITLRDVGPVESLSIPIHPGVVVLRGVNDCGKSVTLDAVSRLAGGNGDVTCREKAASGSVEGLGVTLSVRHSARRSGELEALSIEGKLSVADIVDPKLKDPAAGDRHRIKALLQLTGAEADAATFRGIFPDQDSFDAACTADVLKADDLVEMAARMKRGLEALSRTAAARAEKAEGQALGCKQATDGVDLGVETDASILQAALEGALAEQGQLAGQASTAAGVKAGAESAREKIEKSTPPDVKEATVARTEAQVAINGAQHEVDRLEAEQAAARSELQAAKSAFAEADHALGSEERQAETWAAWQEAISSAENVECPDEATIAAAASKATQCREAIEAGALARQAKANAAGAATYKETARTARRTAESLRDTAKATDNVLSQAVASDSLTVKAGRLITQHPERGEVFFAERSEGTRWKLAIDEAITRIRQLGAERTAIIPVPQAAFSELDPDNRRLIHEHAVSLGVCIITAEATAGDLRAEAFDAK